MSSRSPPRNSTKPLSALGVERLSPRRKKTCVVQTPQHLILCLGRCQHGRGGALKILTDTLIPEEVESTWNHNGPWQYRRYAIIEHIGQSLHHGHYLCTARRTLGGVSCRTHLAGDRESRSVTTTSRQRCTPFEQDSMNHSTKLLLTAKGIIVYPPHTYYDFSHYETTWMALTGSACDSSKSPVHCEATDHIRNTRGNSTMLDIEHSYV